MKQNVIDIRVIAKDLASKTLQGVNNSVKNLASTAKTTLVAGFKAAAAAGAALVAGIGGMALKSASQMETMRTALTTAFQGNIELAKEAEKQITSFASKTPFQLEEVMSGFVKLKNMGLDPSEEALTSYGDTASAMGKSLNDMVEAVADAATGEFERLKEFGIRASSQGDRVKLTFGGVTTEIGKNSEEIQQYLIDLGKTSFAGGMEAQSLTLAGRISTLRDTFSLALTRIAEDSGLMDVAKQAVTTATDAIVPAGDAVVNIINKIRSGFKLLIPGIRDFAKAGDSSNEFLVQLSEKLGISRERFLQVANVASKLRENFLTIREKVVEFKNAVVDLTSEGIEKFNKVIQSPGFRAFISYLKDSALIIFNNLKTTFISLKEPLQGLISSVISLGKTLAPVVAVIAGALFLALVELLKVVSKIATFAIPLLVEAITGLVNFINWWATAVINDVKNVANAFVSFVDGVRTLPDRFSSMFSAIGDAIKNGIGAGIDFAKDKVNELIEGLNKIGNVSINIPGRGETQLIDLPDIPTFATGGSFTTRGKQLIMVGDNAGGRERVTVTPEGQAPQGRGEGMTINNYFNRDVSVDRLATKLAYQLNVI